VSRTITKIKELKERYGLTVLMANFHRIRIADRGYIVTARSSSRRRLGAGQNGRSGGCTWA
jgi:hypothetical protein